jgi:hypothetical protein
VTEYHAIKECLRVETNDYILQILFEESFYIFLRKYILKQKNIRNILIVYYLIVFWQTLSMGIQ